MGKKKNKNSNNNNNTQNQQKPVENENKNENKTENKAENAGDGEKKDAANPTVVLKMDVHCDGCATKIRRYVRGFEGVEKVDTEGNKVSVVGKVDPIMLRDKLAEKMKKKVELVSPLPAKKDKDGKADNKSDDKAEKKPDDKKPKEPPVTTAVLKLSLHCQGCIGKINKTVLKTKGVQEMSLDKQKELVTVKGTMDAKALAETLKEKLKRNVEIVPPKKEKEGGKEGEKKDDGGGGGKKKGGGDGGQQEGGGGGKMEAINRMEMIPGYGGYGYGHPQPGFGYPYGNAYGYPYGNGYGYGQGHVNGGFVDHMQPPPLQMYAPPQMLHQPPPHPPQMFSDENPNACSIM